MPILTPSATDSRETIEHQEEEQTMAERYAGSAGEMLRRDDEKRRDSAHVVDVEAARRDLIARVPYGRALDPEHLVWMMAETNQRNWAIVMRQRLLAHAVQNLPAGVMLTRDELDQVRQDSIDHPTRPGPCPLIAEWPLGR